MSGASWWADRGQMWRLPGTRCLRAPLLRVSVIGMVVSAMHSHRPWWVRRNRPGTVARLGFDETVMASARRLRRRRFVTAAVDAATGQVIDIFDGRDAADLRRWTQQQPRWWTDSVEVVCVDPHEGYRSAVTSLLDDGGLAAEAKIAADPFHIVRLANQALTKCRQRTQTDTTGHRGRKGDPLYGARKLLLMGSERLDGAGWERLRSALGRGDPYDEVADCWEAKEKVRSVFKTPDPEQGAGRLDDAIEYCRAPEAAPRAAPPRHHAAPLAGRDHHQHRNRHPQRAHRSRQRQNQRHKTLSQRLPQPPQPPPPHPFGRRTKTTRNSTRHKNQNPTSQLGRVEPHCQGPQVPSARVGPEPAAPPPAGARLRPARPIRLRESSPPSQLAPTGVGQ